MLSRSHFEKLPSVNHDFNTISCVVCATLKAGDSLMGYILISQIFTNSFVRLVPSLFPHSKRTTREDLEKFSRGSAAESTGPLPRNRKARGQFIFEIPIEGKSSWYHHSFYTGCTCFESSSSSERLDEWNILFCFSRVIDPTCQDSVCHQPLQGPVPRPSEQIHSFIIECSVSFSQICEIGDPILVLIQHKASQYFVLQHFKPRGPSELTPHWRLVLKRVWFLSIRSSCIKIDRTILINIIKPSSSYFSLTLPLILMSRQF